MEFIERCPIKELHYLSNMSFKEYKSYLKASYSNEEERKKYFEIIKKTIYAFIKSNGEIKRLYKFTGGNDWNDGQGSGRLFACGGIQGLLKQLRGFLLKNTTTDIDMVNCHPIILQYLCKKHNIKHTALTFYINNREEILSKYPNREDAKCLYLKAVNTGELNKKIKDKGFKEFDLECNEIQQQLTKLTCYENIVKDVPEHKLYNWYGSAINRILCFYENRLLQVMINYINKKQIEICSLMLDGLLIYGNFYNNSELLYEMEMEIENSFPGINMKLSYKQHNNEIQMPEDYEIPASKPVKVVRYAECDKDAAKYIFDDIKENFKSYKGRLFYKFNNLWISDINKIDDLLLTTITSSNIHRYNEKTGLPIIYCQNVRSAKPIQTLVYAKIRLENDDDEFYIKFHTTTKNKIFFLDGILDFKAKQFYTWDKFDGKDVFSCMQINRNYSEYFKNPNKDVINEIKQKIIEPMFDKKTDILVELLSRAITGNYEDKLWASYLGNRNCGKGVLYELLKYAFGDYVNSFEIGNMMYIRKSKKMTNGDYSKSLYWTIDLEFVRLAISQETPDHNSNSVIDSAILKKLSGGGDNLKARRNFDRCDTNFTIETFFFMMGNNSIEVDIEDCNEHRMEFNSVNQFKTQEEIDNLKKQDLSDEELSRYRVQDITIKDKCRDEAYMNAMVYLLFENFKDKAVQLPLKDKDDEDTGLLGVIKEKIIFTNDETNIVLCSEVFSKINFDKGKITHELNARNIFKKKCRSGEYKNKYVFVGIQLVKEIKQPINPNVKVQEDIEDNECENLDELA